MNKKMLLFLLLTFTSMLVACNDSKSSLKSSDEQTEEYKDGNEILEPIILDFQPVKNPSLEIIDKSIITIVKEITIKDRVFYIYTKLNPTEDVSDVDAFFVGIEVNNYIYEVGEAGYFNTDNINIDIVEVDKKNYFKVSGALGAAYPIEYYIIMQNDNPIMHIYKELPLHVSDLDNDGIIEWISEYDGQVTIYKMINDLWSYASPYKIIDYIYQEKDENTFNLIFNKGSETQRVEKYSFDKNKLVPR